MSVFTVLCHAHVSVPQYKFIYVFHFFSFLSAMILSLLFGHVMVGPFFFFLIECKIIVSHYFLCFPTNHSKAIL